MSKCRSIIENRLHELVNDSYIGLESKELLTLDEFKALGHARLKQLIRTEAVC